LISEVSVAITNKIGLSKIGATIHPYPTYADAIRKLGDQFNKTKLTPMNQRILKWLLRINVGR
ncbi:FAD-containing oxidoreductase, partial [bacterium]|nr:FAD-containing oxidoreductase [bacterium]